MITPKALKSIRDWGVSIHRGDNLNTTIESENNKRRQLTPLLALLIALLCVAGVGIAYAVSIMSTQDVDHNTLDESYILLKTDTSGHMAVDVLDELAFNSVRNGDDTYTYTVDGDYDTNIGGVDYIDAMRISVADNQSSLWTLRVDNHLSASHTNSCTLVVTASDFTPTAGLTYILKVGSNEAIYTNNAWTINSLAYDTDYSVDLYVAGAITTPATEPVSGFTNYSANPSVTGTVFTFTATAS